MKTYAWILAVILSAGLLSAGVLQADESQANHRAIRLLSTIPIPPNVASNSSMMVVFDISWVDPETQRYYLADRSNAVIDVIDARHDAFIKQISGNFKGFTGSNDTSGPNGVVVGGRWLFVTDAPSRVLTFDLRSSPPKTVSEVTTKAGEKTRADELAYDPQDHLILIANDADDPPFLTFISTMSRKVVGQILYRQATGGLEQPVWNPANDMFYQAVPATKANPGGEIDRIDPKTMKLAAIYAVKDCNPAGLTLGPQQHLLMGCSGDPIAAGAHAQVLVMDATDGSIVATITQVGGSDQVWYNPGDNRYYTASRYMTSTGLKGGTPTPVLGVIDAATDQWIANLPTGTGAHSVAADPGNNRVFVPVPQGIAVFAH